MVLKHYWRIIWKRAWIPALLVVIVGVVSLLTTTTPPPSYSTTMRFNVGVKPQELTGQYTYDSYYAWLSSEYLADDLSAMVSSQEFANDINRHLAEMGSTVQIPPGSITGVTVAEKQHRLLRLNLTWGNAAELAEISAATVSALQQDSPKYLTQLGTSGALIGLIDPPAPPVASPPSLTQRLNLPVRLLLAVVAGLALVFLLEYLDDSVRSRAELEAMGLTVLTEVPRQKR